MRATVRGSDMRGKIFLQMSEEPRLVRMRC
jgi:hypothetical protein